MEKKILAGLAAGVLMFGIAGTAWATQMAAGTNLKLTIKSDNTLSNAWLITGKQTDGEWFLNQNYIGDVSSTGYSNFFSVDPSITGYTILGIYDGSNGVTVGMPNGAYTTDNSWNNSFNTLNTRYNEEVIADNLTTPGSSLSLTKGFVTSNIYVIGNLIGSSLDLVDFSGATEGGTAMATWQSTAPVPEPATILLFGIGIAGLAGSGIKRKNSGNKSV